MCTLAESRPIPILPRLMKLFRRYSCAEYCEQDITPCCISLIDVERWFYEEFVRESSVRKPEKDTHGKPILSTTHLKPTRRHAFDYESEKAKVVEDTRNSNPNYANRCSKFGCLPLALIDHLHSLDYVISPVVCLDHIIRFETIGKILCALTYAHHLKNSGYIQLTEADYKRALTKLKNIIKFYDYRHFTDKSIHCDQCTKYGMTYLFARFVDYVVTQTETLHREHKFNFFKSARFADKILNELEPNGVINKREKSKNKLLQRRGENYYIVVEDHEELYSNIQYGWCTQENHKIQFHCKIVYTYSIIDKKIHNKTVEDILATCPTPDCNICYDSLSDAETLGVSRFCRHIFCGKCLRKWDASKLIENR